MNSETHSFDTVERQLQKNQAQFSNIETFLQTKQMELQQLQNFLLEEFQEMENWKDQKDQISQLFNNQIKQLLANLRDFCGYFKKQYQRVLYENLKGSMNQFRNYVKCKDQMLGEKDQIIKSQEQTIRSQRQEIVKLKGEVNQERRMMKVMEFNHNISAFNPPNYSNSNNLKSERKLIEYGYGYRDRSPQQQQRNQEMKKSNIMAKSSINLEYHLSRSKSRELKDAGNHPHQQQEGGGGGSQTKKYPFTKQIMREVQKNLKEDHENNKNSYEYKKYVKDKIQQFKVRNSGVCIQNNRRF